MAAVRVIFRTWRDTGQVRTRERAVVVHLSESGGRLKTTPSHQSLYLYELEAEDLKLKSHERFSPPSRKINFRNGTRVQSREDVSKTRLLRSSKPMKGVRVINKAGAEIFIRNSNQNSCRNTTSPEMVVDQ
jgi:hypothetical protein